MTEDNAPQPPTEPPLAAPAGPQPRAPRWVLPVLVAGGAVIVVLVVLVAVVATRGGDDTPDKTDQPTGSATPSAKTFTASGTLTLTDSGVSSNGGADCYGTEGYDDMVEGAQIVVRDADGKTVGIGQLDAGFIGGSDTVCEFTFAVDDIPSGVGPYSVEVSHRGEIAFTEDDASSLSLSLG